MKKAKNITMIFSTDIPVCEGIGTHVLGLAKQLKKRGGFVTLITRGKWFKKEELEYEGFRVIKVPFLPLYPFHIHIHGIILLNILRSLTPKPDIIHLHSPLVPPLPKEWPIITTFHSPMIEGTANIYEKGIKTQLIKIMGKTISYKIEKKLLDISDAVIVLRQGILKVLKTSYNFNKNNIFVIPNVIDTSFYTPPRFFPTEKKLLYVGRIDYGKGLIELIESAKYVIEKHPDVKYEIIGGGPLERKIKKMIKRNGLENYFVFHGKIHDRSRLLRHYQEAYAIILPTYYEGFPMVILEAMACGKPIVTTNIDFSKEILKNRTNALLVPPKSIRHLGKAISELLSSKDLAIHLGNNARKSIIKISDSETNIQMIENIYKFAMEKFRGKNL